MKNNFKKEIGVSAVLVVLLLVTLNPFDILMPSMGQIVALAFTVAVFGIFASFILREGAGDERESTHRMFAGRVAFLAGATVLILGIVEQGLWAKIDVWLVAALVAMVVGKVVARLYTEKHL